MGKTSGQSGLLIKPSDEEILLRKLGDHYYGIFLLRAFDGIIHNLNGPLQSLFIRSEQMEQNLMHLQRVLESHELGKADELATRMKEKMKGILNNLDGLNVQLRGLASDFVIGGRSEVGDVDLNDVIQSCLFVLNANMLFKHQVAKTFKLNDALPPVKARETDLSVMVLNLVQNALEAMADTDDKHLLIETATEAGKVILKIQDSGCGIPEKDLQKINRIFFTTKGSMGSGNELEKHAGLGLSIVSLLLQDCDGSMSCESVPGKTTFTLQIPAMRDSSEAA